MDLPDVSFSKPHTAFSLVYISDISPALQADAETQRIALQDIGNAARKHNPVAGVRGVLLYAAGFFIQWLEGDEAAVTDLMQRIVKDPRHTHVQVVFAGDSPQMLTEWSMSMASRADKNDTFRQLLATLRSGQVPKQITGSTPADIFQGLLVPQQLPHTQPHQQSCQVALVGQTGLWSAAVITYLSTLWQVPLQRTRLVGNDGFEREALLEYIDAVHPRLGPIRVVNFSGHVLKLGWVNSLLNKFDVHALFYSVNQLDSAIDFSEIAINSAGSSAKKSAKVSLFGRTAQPMMAPVAAWFDAKGIATDCVSTSLADVTSVWQSIEALIVKVVAPAQSASVRKLSATLASVTVPLARLATSPVLAPAPPDQEAQPAEPVWTSTPARQAALPKGTQALKLVSVKPAPVADVSAVEVCRTQVHQPVAPAMTHEGRYWLESLLEIQGIRWAGMQWPDHAAQAGLAMDWSAKPANANADEQANRLTHHMAQELRLHSLLRKRVDAGEELRVVTCYGGAFEVSYGLTTPEGTFVLLLQSASPSTELALVLFEMQKRLESPLPHFFHIAPALKLA